MASVRHFHRPGTADEAVSLKAMLGARAAYLGGGTLLNSLRAPPGIEHIISLDRLDLPHIERTNGELVLGARCTLQELLESELVPPQIDAACRHVQNRSVRNVATIGGHLGARQPYADLLPILVALEATVHMAGADPLPLPAWIEAPPTHAFVTALHVSTAALDRRWAVGCQGRGHGDHSTITAACTLRLERGVIEDPIVAMGGVGCPVGRLRRVEEAIVSGVPPTRDALEAWVCRSVDPAPTVRGTVEFKRHLAGVIGANVVLDACGGAR